MVQNVWTKEVTPTKAPEMFSQRGQRPAQTRSNQLPSSPQVTPPCSALLVSRLCLSPASVGISLPCIRYAFGFPICPGSGASLDQTLPEGRWSRTWRSSITGREMFSLGKGITGPVRFSGVWDCVLHPSMLELRAFAEEAIKWSWGEASPCLSLPPAKNVRALSLIVNVARIFSPGCLSKEEKCFRTRGLHSKSPAPLSLTVCLPSLLLGSWTLGSIVFYLLGWPQCAQLFSHFGLLWVSVIISTGCKTLLWLVWNLYLSDRQSRLYLYI